MRTIGLAFLIFAGLASTAQVPAQMLSDAPLRSATAEAATAANVERHQDWLLVCAGRAASPACELQPAVSDSQGPRPPVVAIVVPEAGTAPVMVIRTPLEMLLAEGIALSVDGAALGRLAYQTCDAGGCVAPARLEGRLASALRDGLSLVLRSVSRDGESTTTNVSLRGVTAGLAALAR